MVTWMRDLGLRVDVDGIGNVVGTWPADRHEPPVLTGSHIDSVATGGIYDGALGVLAGLEVIETVAAAGVETARPLAVGVLHRRGGQPLRARHARQPRVRRAGSPLEAALDTVGRRRRGAAATSSSASATRARRRVRRCRRTRSWSCTSSRARCSKPRASTIGVVTGVQGISWTELTITGQSNHAGTTPMDHRHDAGLRRRRDRGRACARWPRSSGRRWSRPSGASTLHPNLVNVVAGAGGAHRRPAPHRRHRARRPPKRRSTRSATSSREREGVTIDRAVAGALRARRVRRRASSTWSSASPRAQGRSTQRMPSGAGHDAQMLARVCPPGWCSCPARGGVSHNPAEHTDDEQLAAGADVLLQVMLELAGRP